MKTTSLVVFLLIAAVPARGQDTLTDLNTPSSPAATVLGAESESVIAPKTYRTLETALYSNFVSAREASALPDDFALEFTPYWAINHGLTLDEYLFPPSAWDQIKRSSSFSIASTQAFQLGDSSLTPALGFGYRTTLHFSNDADRRRLATFRSNLRLNQRVRPTIGSRAELLAATVADKAEFLNAIRDDVERLAASVRADLTDADIHSLVQNIVRGADDLPELDPDNPDGFLDAFYQLIDRELELDPLLGEFEAYTRNRYGLYIDFAYGVFVSFPDRSYESGIAPRQAVWITPAYRFRRTADFLTILGVARYQWYDDDYYKQHFPESKVFQNTIDLGLAVRTEFDRLSLKYEAVWRRSRSERPAGTDDDGNALYRKDSQHDFKHLGTFSYRLSEWVNLSYSIGKRFDPLIAPVETLISSLAINLGFGSPGRDDLRGGP